MSAASTRQRREPPRSRSRPRKPQGRSLWPQESLPRQQRTLRSLRWRSRAPRIALYVIAAVLSLAGLKTIAQGPPAKPPPPPAPALPDEGAQAFAESFARAYLTFDASDPDAYDRALRPFVGGADVEGVQPHSGEGSQSVEWTAAFGDVRSGKRRRVTVAAALASGALTYLEVPVERDRQGLFYVADQPAIVGAPAVAQRSSQVTLEDEVDDAALAAVLKRALTNYIAGQSTNLRADLADSAVVSLPSDPLALRSVRELVWRVRGASAVARIEAQTKDKDLLALSYELGVLRRSGRWYVSSIESNPTHKGGSR